MTVCQLIIHDKQLFLHFCVPKFVESENLPPNSPDLYPVEHSIWGAPQQVVHHRHRTQDTEQLKEVVQSYKPAGSRLVKTLSIALQGSFAKTCRWLL